MADIKAWANPGLHFAEKLRGAVALETYKLKGGEENKRSAVQHSENALKYWDAVIAITRPIHNDMPLVHYSEQDGKFWKENDHLRFRWEKLRLMWRTMLSMQKMQRLTKINVSGIFPVMVSMRAKS